MYVPASLTILASEAAEPSGNLLVALGVDWRLLIVQIIAFLVLVWLLGKFVYPWLMKSVDKRQSDLQAVAQAAQDAQQKAQQTQQDMTQLLANARAEAAGIVDTARTEAADIAQTAESRATQTAERIVADAKEQLGKEVAAARRDLHNQTLDLVAAATQKVVGKTHDASADEALISALLKESD